MVVVWPTAIFIGAAVIHPVGRVGVGEGVSVGSVVGPTVGVSVGVAVGGVDTSMVIESRTSVWPLWLVFKVTLPLPGGLQPSSVPQIPHLTLLRAVSCAFRGVRVSTWIDA